ncbi:Tripartite-type tricarboxylate transporter, receptor component TctC [Bradyrhizobium sp. NFR13]|jgi:tripartite-type tricarboxylate transporter receptor subunit TctC|uniref:Bug family tripartite tricarboxylate transporter substrate binding protein n=1 Tax=Bradyrhizobium sp. NFR13 TaxID=1566285 RepID=UPI0008EED40C|nr:tripartite tricarboxylate transporter substrate binding protein [Bradyrhizobium sp. NFR13]SFL29198.1 Tripartite-type tricarboxylate transporter, receptor component TctC [Bradyrhizobium sp. NFR13]
MRALIAGICGLVFALTPIHSAVAQGWPERTVTMIVPFPAGSAVDTLARAVGQALSEALGKQFIVDNRAGAGGSIGGAAVAKASADGYTLLFGTPAPIALNKLMYKGMTYDSEKDFTPVVLVAKSPLIVTTRTEFPAKTFEELIAYAKQNPDKVNVGHPGNGTLGHITSELVQRSVGVKMTNVPYRGTSPLMTDLLGGQIDVAIDFMPTYVPLVTSGKIQALAVTTSQRAAQLPAVPTVQETGFKGFEASAWYAMVAPTGTSPEIVAKLNSVVNSFLQSEKGKAILGQNALLGVGGSPDDLKAFVAAELAKWRPVIEAAKIAM